MFTKSSLLHRPENCTSFYMFPKALLLVTRDTAWNHWKGWLRLKPQKRADGDFSFPELLQFGQSVAAEPEFREISGLFQGPEWAKLPCGFVCLDPIRGFGLPSKTVPDRKIPAPRDLVAPRCHWMWTGCSEHFKTPNSLERQSLWPENPEPQRLKQSLRQRRRTVVDLVHPQRQTPV